ncbi:hypothetical protein B296_00027398 [Ensete ventricosum]|uniref:Uncharacterized protein n=1 Tax=Ensete ventricosum TaxID=4639 RepID=A0A426ZQL0_ENSVE|nr:hypothetical protein B296_00027398 [Ensete ventricosum]
MQPTLVLLLLLQCSFSGVDKVLCFLLHLLPVAYLLLYDNNYTSRPLPSSHIFLSDCCDHGPHTRSSAESHPTNNSFYNSSFFLPATSRQRHPTGAATSTARMSSSSSIASKAPT